MRRLTGNSRAVFESKAVRRGRGLIASLVLLCTASASVTAAVIEGEVRSDTGKPIAGAIITLTDPEARRSVSVYSDALGHYQLNADMTGAVRLRARAPHFSDTVYEVKLAEDGARKHTLTMAYQEDPQALSNALTASAHAAQLAFGDGEDEKAFRSQCHFCHQIGNELTRRPRSEAEWQSVIERMQSYGVLLTGDNETAFRQVLSETFDGQTVSVIQSYDVSPELSMARYEEWQIGNAASYIHDIEAGRDGKLYGVDMGNDLLFIIDPDTGERETIAFPSSDLPLGGMFSGGIAPLGTFNARHGPHSIQEGPDGKMWTTNSLAAEIMSFDPETRDFKFYPIGEDAIYPHTLRWDEQGILWFTLALSNQVGRFDPATESFTLIDTPSNGFWRWLSDAFFPSILEVASWFPKEDLHLTLSHHQSSGEGHKILNVPYGIDINPVDGSIWYSKLYAGYIGRVDPETQEVQEITTPLRGPRRLRFDASGTLWIPSFDESGLMKFDPATETFTVYEMPTLSPDEYEVPYALGIHPETQDVWITSNLSDRVFRFVPDEERFISYPSPTRVTYLRDMVFLPDGRVCSSNANLPAHAIEGGLPKVLCIDEDALSAIPAIDAAAQAGVTHGH